MKNKNKALLGVGIVSMATIGILAFLKWKKHHERKQEHMLATVADEGYETAYDVLYPMKKSRMRGLF